MVRIDGHLRDVVVTRGDSKHYHDRIDISLTVLKGTVTDETISLLLGYDRPRDYHRTIVVGTCLRGEEYPSPIPFTYHLMKMED